MRRLCTVAAAEPYRAAQPARAFWAQPCQCTSWPCQQDPATPSRYLKLHRMATLLYWTRTASRCWMFANPKYGAVPCMSH